jgi:hypothetical protein
MAVSVLAVVLTAVGVMAFTTGPAAAHDPLILGPEDAAPADGPLLPDGTISFALYGVIEQPGDARAFRVAFAAGDPLRATVLIPDLAPENTLVTGSLPVLDITRPDGTVEEVRPSIREPFAEPFTGTNYITYIRVDEVAEAGEYAFTVRGDVPARFTVAVGEKEQFGTPVIGVDDRSGGLAGVQAWYATPPPEASATGSGDDATSALDEAGDADVVDAYVTASPGSSMPWGAIGTLVVATVLATGAVVMVRRARQTH